MSDHDGEHGVWDGLRALARTASDGPCWCAQPETISGRGHEASCEFAREAYRYAIALLHAADPRGGTRG